MNRAPLRIVPKPPPPDDGGPSLRPEVRITHTSRAENVDALDAAFFALPDAYQRSLQLVEVVVETRPGLVAQGTPVIRPLNQHSLGTLIDRHLRCMKWHEGTRTDPLSEWRECAVPVDVALLPMLHCGRWRTPRPISAIVESPFLRPDWAIWQTAGYDPGTGYLYRPNATFPTVPENPTQEDGRTALLSLQHVFCDFPYTSAAAAAVPIACLLTILARAAINGNVPLFMFEASVQGSGKTKQGDAVHVIATGRLPAHSSFPQDEDEQRKELLGMALSGAPVYFLDNVKGLFGGAPLEAVLHTAELRQRVLGQTEQAVVRWLPVVIVTGNNMRPTRDILRRSLVSRLEPDVEDPTKGRTFQHHPLLPWVFAERERLIVAALTVLRAYACKGCPDTGAGNMESCDEWSRLVPGAIMFAGGPNVLDAIGQAEDAGTDDAEAVACIIRELPRLSIEPLTAKAIIQAVYPAPRHDEEPDGWDDFRTALEAIAPTRNGAAPTPKALGDALGSFKGQVSSGSRLVRRFLHGSRRWSVESVRRPTDAGT